MTSQRRTTDALPKRKASINRHFICRTAGLPVHALDRLRASESVNAHSETSALQEALRALSPEVADGLFAAIDGEQDQGLRRSLLRLKRDAHNLRKLRGSDLDAARSHVPDQLICLLERYQELLAKGHEAKEAARAIHQEELAKIRRQFQEAVGHEDFAKGLLLSSLSLSDNVKRYTRASADKPGAKARQIERSLMRYFSRTVMKATPFSTFCVLLPGELSTEVETPTFHDAPDTKQGHLRLNKTLYALLLPHLLSRQSIRRHVELEINPTLQNDGDRQLFLTARGNQEIFQRIAPNPVIELLRQQLEDAGRLPWQTLVDTLCEHPDIEASPEEGAAYVDRLLDIGLFRVRMGIAEQEAHWDRPLAGFLSAIDDPVAQLAVTFLNELRSAVDSYAEADAAARRHDLVHATSLVKDLFKQLAPNHPETKAAPFYEDTGGPARLELNLGPLEDALLDYANLTSRLAWPRSEQASMRHFFDTFYGEDQGPLPLLRFYEDYFREHFKEHLIHQEGHSQGSHQGPREADPAPEENPKENPADKAANEVAARNETVDDSTENQPKTYSIFNPFGLDFLDDLDQGHQALSHRIQELWAESPDVEEIVLRRRDFESAVEKLPALEAGPVSVSFFTQYVHNFRADGEPALVARTYLTGFGKYFSRFLYLLPEQMLKDLQNDNRQMTELELAEICGDANFNANLHPPLLPKELSYPTGESGLEQHQILSSDIVVERDPGSPHRLRLIRASNGKQVVPVDLGFLNPRLRPPLFQLLSRFTPALNFNLPIPDTINAQRDSEVARPRYRPRISYEGKLVLARRQWQISGDEFPTPKPQEDATAYFFRAQEWRRGLGLPKEVFMRVNVLPKPPNAAGQKGEIEASDGSPEPAAAAQEQAVQEQAESPKQVASPKPTQPKNQPIREHLYKPQYIDFENPLLVDLFSRTSETLEHFFCTFEERLPAHEHLIGKDGDRFATEMIFQADFPDGSELR